MDSSISHDPFIKRGQALNVGMSMTLRESYGLENAHVTLYLDDTSNFDNGMGNTRLVSFNRCKHFDGKDSMHIADVNWSMMGALKKNNGVRNPFPMPNVAKVVVTAEVNGQHGIVGGALMPLDDMFKALTDPSQKMFSIPIYNSFFKLPHLVPAAANLAAGDVTTTNSAFQQLAANDPGACQLTVEFHAGTNIHNEHTAYKKMTEQKLFKPTEMPSKVQSWVLGNMLGPIVKELFLTNMSKGIYMTPLEAPPGFDGWPNQAKFDNVDKIPGVLFSSIY